MKLSELYERIPIGEKNAVPLDELIQNTGLGERTLRAYFARLIYLDKPVCSLGHGYFRPASREELAGYRKIINSYKRAFEKKEYRLRKAEEHFDMQSFL